MPSLLKNLHASRSLCALNLEKKLRPPQIASSKLYDYYPPDFKPLNEGDYEASGRVKATLYKEKTR